MNEREELLKKALEMIEELQMEVCPVVQEHTEDRICFSELCDRATKTANEIRRALDRMGAEYRESLRALEDRDRWEKKRKESKATDIDPAIALAIEMRVGQLAGEIRDRLKKLEEEETLSPGEFS